MSIPFVLAYRNALVLNGAFLGFTIGLGMLIVTGGDMGMRSLWFLGAATAIGSLTGLDLYLTRKWKRFGRFTPSLRFIVACTGAAGLTSSVGIRVGVISPQLAWAFTALGAITGLLYGIYLVSTSA